MKDESTTTTKADIRRMDGRIEKVEADVHVIKGKVERFEGAVDNLIDINGGGGLNVRAGYRVTSWFAAEFMYQWTTGLDAEIRGTEFNFYEFRNHSVLGNFKFVLPMWRIQPYIGIGLGAQKGDLDFQGLTNTIGLFDDEKSWGFLGRPAFGIDFIASDHWVFNFELAGELALHDLSSANFSGNNFFGLSVGGGLQYRF